MVYKLRLCTKYFRRSFMKTMKNRKSSISGFLRRSKSVCFEIEFFLSAIVLCSVDIFLKFPNLEFFLTFNFVVQLLKQLVCIVLVHKDCILFYFLWVKVEAMGQQYCKISWPCRQKFLFSVFGVFLIRIHSECGKLSTRKTPNTDTFHAVE